MTQRVTALIVCPCDSDTIGKNLEGAEKAGIPVFTADIFAKTGKIVSQVASDNVLGGRLAAQAMARFLGERGKVLIINHATVASVQDRVRGFEEELRKHPSMAVVASQDAGGKREKALRVMEDMLQAHPDLKGVFGINDDSALGALSAIEAARRGDIVVIGYDATPDARAAIARGSALKALESGSTDVNAAEFKPILALVRAIARSDITDLTVVSYAGPDLGLLCAAGKVRRAVYAFASLDTIPLEPHFRAARQAGAVDDEPYDEGLFLLGLQAAAWRVPFLPTRVGLGSDLLALNDRLRTVRSPYDDGEEWAHRCSYDGPHREAVVRSLITLRTLTHSATGVAFNGAPATFTVVSDLQITATVPAEATTGKISVTTPGGTGSSSADFSVLVAPVISSFTPASGPAGTLVSIDGSAFTGATSAMPIATASPCVYCAYNVAASRACPRVWPKLRIARTPRSVGSSCTTRTFTAMARSMSVVRTVSCR